LLATGGGKDDRSLRLWNVNTGSFIKYVNTGKQVTELVWSTVSKHILLGITKPDDFTDSVIGIFNMDLKIVETLEGHQDRILAMHMTRSGNLITSSADESIKFWRPFLVYPKKKAKDSMPKKKFVINRPVIR
jgi:cell division cycle protein 20 (cofactor of APC complex)